ncbi:phosphonoacetaldehyde hydrolase [Staphylococcus gallinarum]|uniref:Phosphonoacetaldehyde hydrolase n=1 Tax=Staphylococcus gallinarum TaxID=1293 RepID=A0A2T4SZT3_STAGA|nr:phosphonoacetaldehyde hydrolase [Staphylococcus gallinarum]MCD8820988.1 phosphonoacetaldehyde hydrolase [Staphylococcus gallinarum]PTL07890.1 phosphonoacetaldehyde hydrolase [Staphylococcus gallinarum]PTL11094.1 phosphonoacetaldehyde hydrolase [Staphylococcus gallinarum]RIL29957.1 phosphonoacetaldehyde hydrolase [Staphylococcus gallinarum]RIL44413.1 phosphonoacetaldehyde hydrolase [Staphylococcus gallinarum]
MAKIKGIIFDWAGTTVDFGCFAPVHVFIDIFNEVGIEVTIDEAREPMGMLKRDHIQSMLEMPRIQKLWKEKYHRTYSEKDLDKLYNRFEVLLMENLRSFTDPLPNVIEVIENLREQGYNIGSTTGYTTEMMEVVKLGAKEKGYEPDYIVTADDVGGYGRPYPYMIYENMRKFELNSINELVKVGDTISDIKEAINGGITAIGVIKGSSVVGLSEKGWNNLKKDEKNKIIEEARDKFIKNGANYVLEDITELPNLLEKLGVK